MRLRAVVVKDPAGTSFSYCNRITPPARQGTGDIRNVRVRHTVENLDRAVALYRDALGLQGGVVPINLQTSPPVADSLGVPASTQWRYTQLLVPTSGLPFELIEFKGARRPAPPDIADPGATRIQLRVADIDAAAAALVKAGGTFISTGGKPLDLPAGNSTIKVGVVRDPDGYFIVLINAPPAAR
jgi:catechol 2,3-dioxygenase-like lactoylglutathione lyase family enzyme